MKKTNLFLLPAQAILMLMLCCAAFTSYAQTVYYADASRPDNSGAGTSWATAKKDIQNAIALAASGDQVWVKQGTYFPTTDPFGNASPADARNKTFLLKDGVSLYGGFAGTETSLAQRNVIANVTILSGDIGTLNNSGDNCYHVVMAVFNSLASSCTIDGFTIKDGNANGALSLVVNTFTISQSNGGGIYFRTGNNVIANNIITGNAAAIGGGGVYHAGTASLTNSRNTMVNNTISNNSAANGGGCFSVLCSDSMNNNSFSVNHATNGGGMYINSGNISILNTDVLNNTAVTNGGGLYFISNGLYCCNLSVMGNTAANGGGLCTNSNSGNIINSVFYNNTASTNGGGLYLLDFFSSNLVNTTIVSNNAANGGGIYTQNSSISVSQMYNNIFWGNMKSSNLTVPGADYFDGGAKANIFFNNLLQLPPSNYTITSSGNYALGATASGNIFGVDPNFINSANPAGADNINRTADDGLRLQAGSLAINASSTAISSPVTDIIGNTRGVVPFDAGAYEWFTCSNFTTLYVDASVATSGNGKTWATAYKTLDEALFEANTCVNISTINIAKGTYIPSKKPYTGGIEMTTADPRDVSFYLRGNLALYGGFPSGGGSRNVAANPTILSGDIGVPGDTADNCYHVVLVAFTNSAPVTVVDGFTITAGNAGTNSILSVNGIPVSRALGGGMFIRFGTNTISNNTFISNNAFSGGGGLYCANFSPVAAPTNIFNHNTWLNNTANFAGGVYSVLCSNAFLNNVFSGNRCVTVGGGLYCNGCIDSIAGNLFTLNKAASGGGFYSSGSDNTFLDNDVIADTAVNGAGCYFSGNSHVIVNNLFSGNASSGSGGALYITGTFSVALNNNTIYNNSAALNGGGLYSVNGINQATVVSNTIFWGNTKAGSASLQGADYYEAGTLGNLFLNNMLQLSAANYSITNNGNYNLGSGAAGNLFNTDPLFVNSADVDGADNILNTADDGLRLQCGSTAIDNGYGSTPAADIMNISRQIKPDIGAYESNALSNNSLPVAFKTITQNQSGNTVYGLCSDLIVSLQSAGGSPVFGNTTASVWIESTQPASFVRRHYEITPTLNAASATGRVTLYFTQADFDAFNTVNVVKLPSGPADASGISNLLIEKFSGTSNNGTGLPGSYTNGSVTINPDDFDITWNAAFSRWEVSFSVTGFSGFFVKTQNVPLPLKWISVNGSLNSQHQAVLNWTVQEQDVQQYVIEKSLDGRTFITAGSINSRGNGEHVYQFTDTAITYENVFYRIKQTSSSGMVSWSAVIKLSNYSGGRLLVYPVPFNNNFTVNTPNAQHAVILDAQGRMVKTIVLNRGINTVAADSWGRGVYFLQTENSGTIKLVKE